MKLWGPIPTIFPKKFRSYSVNGISEDSEGLREEKCKNHKAQRAELKNVN